MEKCEQLTLELVFEQVEKDGNGVIENVTVEKSNFFDGVKLIEFDINLTPSKKYHFAFFTDERISPIASDYLKAISDCLSDMHNKVIYWTNVSLKIFSMGFHAGLVSNGLYGIDELEQYQPQFTKAANVLKKYLD